MTSVASVVQLPASAMGLSAICSPYRRLYRVARIAISSGVAPLSRSALSPLFHLPRSTSLVGPMPSGPQQACTHASHSGSGARGLRVVIAVAAVAGVGVDDEEAFVLGAGVTSASAGATAIATPLSLVWLPSSEITTVG
jgi:hypothetical protein